MNEELVIMTLFENLQESSCQMKNEKTEVINKQIKIINCIFEV